MKLAFIFFMTALFANTVMAQLDENNILGVQVFKCTPISYQLPQGMEVSLLCAGTSAIPQENIDRCLLQSRSAGPSHHLFRSPLNFLSQDEKQASFVSLVNSTITVTVFKAEKWYAEIRNKEALDFICQ